MVRPFLTAEQHRQLYDWIDASLFQTEPEYYDSFVLCALKATVIQRIYDKPLLAVRSIPPKIQFPDDVLDRLIIIPFCGEDGPFRPFSHMNAYLAAINLHQHIRALGADHSQIAKLFHFLSFHAA